MALFPEFMKRPENRIAAASQHTPGVVGYVFDGVDGTQMAFWECSVDASTAPHVHPFDEYLVVIEGCYRLTIDGRELCLSAGEECFIPRGSRISGTVSAGTRTIHAFGGPRAQRAEQLQAPSLG